MADDLQAYQRSNCNPANRYGRNYRRGSNHGLRGVNRSLRLCSEGSLGDVQDLALGYPHIFHNDVSCFMRLEFKHLQAFIFCAAVLW